MRNDALDALRVSGRLALDRLLVDDAPGLHFEHLPDPRTRRSWRTTGSDDGGRVSAARYVEGIPGVPRQGVGSVGVASSCSYYNN